ncbi:hypothetical protein [Pseudomonas sp. TCU-HL1]|uniref:hypothetical protein n=1 Tax=Pseudomonas sp. TCU-HL1 TaxID=1856685 RepID=UPI0008568B49|nr:hypothetical protein [Pseudomonas sp. TCU-HL1]AOE85578.1 hypothetical protein THL1_3030 [Pseudomonas sp. TCU-HL1]AOE85591.1 hypothetical protein THL1_3043 [Pseudomonas sp. TCU-HL1]
MIAATLETIFWLALGLLAIQRLGFWARSPAAPRSPKSKFSNPGNRPSFTPVR